MYPKLLAMLLLVVACGVLARADDWPWAKYGIPQSTVATCIPTERTDWASQYHTQMLVREKAAAAKVIFLGDSITMMWRTQSGYEGGTPVWEKAYAALPAANLGISGDKTQHILWRITGGGDLDGTAPKVLVLLIGINNLLQGDSPETTAAGIKTIVTYLRTKLPDTRILLLGVFPCWEKADDPARTLVKRTNQLIRPLEDRKRVFYLDFGHKLVEPDGSISKVKLRDLLHLSEIGYGIWAEVMQPYLQDLLTNEGKGVLWDQRGDGGMVP